jgi:hypothetical protein
MMCIWFFLEIHMYTITMFCQIFNCPIICKTGKYIDQSVQLSAYALFLIPEDLGDSWLIGRLKIWPLIWPYTGYD